MRNKLKKVIVLICFMFMFLPVLVSADSGFDSDYGSSGGSFDDSNYHSESDYSGSSKDVFLYIIFILVDVAFVAAIYIMRKNEIKKFTELKDQDNKSDVVLKRDYNSSRDLGLDSNPYIGDYDEEVAKYFPEMDEKKLIKKLVDIFIDTQEAWMLFDYDSLKKLCSAELYNSYKSDLEVMNMKNEQNIMDDFKLEACNIKEIKEENGLIIVELYVHLIYRDYIVNTNTGDVVRGDFNKVVHNQFDLEYIISKSSVDDTCPSCGSKLESNVSECNYCHTVINNKYSDFVLNVKRKN